MGILHYSGKKREIGIDDWLSAVSGQLSAISNQQRAKSKEQMH
jgi:hypothetical protein